MHCCTPKYQLWIVETYQLSHIDAVVGKIVDEAGRDKCQCRMQGPLEPSIPKRMNFGIEPILFIKIFIDSPPRAVTNTDFYVTLLFRRRFDGGGK